MMKRFYKAFTLTELLVALGVIAIIVAILLPVISNLMPDSKVIMAKRAYYAAQTIVDEMINDESCYPDRSYEDIVGFGDYSLYPNCVGWRNKSDDITGGGASSGAGTNAADTKFMILFYNHLGAKINTAGSGTTILPEELFATTVKTADGMQWMIDKSKSGAFEYSAHHNNAYLYLRINVLGTGGVNNVGTMSEKPSDEIHFIIYQDGGVEPFGCDPNANATGTLLTPPTTRPWYCDALKLSGSVIKE